MCLLEVELQEVVRLVVHEAIHRVREDLAADALRVEALNIWVSLREVNDYYPSFSKLIHYLVLERFVRHLGMQVRDAAQLYVAVHVGRLTGSSLARQEH